MILNITEQQKNVIESQGYMVIQFKVWVKNFLDWFGERLKTAINTWNMILAYLKHMAFKVTESLQEVGLQIKEVTRKLFKPEEIDFYIEPRPKYEFVRNIGRKYEVRYTQPVIYWRCRNNC